jgi:hypothetical protein
MVAEALDIAAKLKKHGGFDTGVEPAGNCSSACVMIWAVGVHKYAYENSHIGVHSTVLPLNKKSAGLAGFKEIGENAVTAEVARQLGENGAPASVVGRVVMTPANSVYWLTAEDIAAWGAHPPDETLVPPSFGGTAGRRGRAHELHRQPESVRRDCHDPSSAILAR